MQIDYFALSIPLFLLTYCMFIIKIFTIGIFLFIMTTLCITYMILIIEEKQN